MARKPMLTHLERRNNSISQISEKTTKGYNYLRHSTSSSTWDPPTQDEITQYFLYVTSQGINAEKVKFWQREAASLRQQLQYLHESYRQLMGEELFGLSMKDLEHLESKLETSLKGVRVRKDQILADEIKGLNQKVNHIQEENAELKRRITIVQQENADLQKKLLMA